MRLSKSQFEALRYIRAYGSRLWLNARTLRSLRRLRMINYVESSLRASVTERGALYLDGWNHGRSEPR